MLSLWILEPCQCIDVQHSGLCSPCTNTIHVHTHIHTHIYTHTHTHTHRRSHSHIHTDAPPVIHTHIHTHTHTDADLALAVSDWRTALIDCFPVYGGKVNMSWSCSLRYLNHL